MRDRLLRTLLAILCVVLLIAAVKDVAVEHLFARAEVMSVDEVMYDESFQAAAGERLNIDVGHVDVVVMSGNEARVRVTLNGRNMDRARDWYEHLNFEIDHRDGDLMVRTRPSGSWNWSNGGADVNVLITVPEVFDTEIDLQHGDLEIASLRGSHRFDIAHGDVDAGILSGTSLRVDVAHGDFDAKGLMSEKIRLDVQHGDMEFDAVTASELDISLAHSDIELENVDAPIQFDAQHGDISVEIIAARGGEFTAAHGDIDLYFDEGVGLDLDLHSSDIDIDSSHKFEGTSREESLKGQINGGGPLIRARARHGVITIGTR